MLAGNHFSAGPHAAVRIGQFQSLSIGNQHWSIGGGLIECR